MKKKSIIFFILTSIFILSCDPCFNISNSENYELTVNAGSNGTITEPSTSPIEVISGEVININAEPDTNYAFTEWTIESGTGVNIDDVNSTSTTVTLTESDATIKANFEPITYMLTVNAGDNGTITEPSTSTIEVISGMAINITANADTNYTFTGWTIESGTGVNIDDVNSSNTTVTLTESDATIQANFILSLSVWNEVTTQSPIWTERHLHSSVVFDNKMWVIGGTTDGGKMDDVWSSEDGINWTEETSSADWSERTAHTSVVYDGKMWVLGGEDSSGDVNDVWSSENGIDWVNTTTDAGWSGRKFFASVVFNDKIWVLGGADGSGQFRNDIWTSEDGTIWTEEVTEAEWDGRMGHICIVHNNKLWIIAGKYLNDVWSSEDGLTWTEETSSASWTGRAFHCGISYNDKLWTMGGYAPPYLNDVWGSYDGIDWTSSTTNAEWSERWAFTTLYYKNKVWILGGSNFSGKNNDVYWSY
jgi:hypothetical protein